MTDEICARDAYQTTCEAIVVAVIDGGVVLDRTVFYARGGGQPGDSGVLGWGERTVAVTETIRDRDTGEVLHVLDGASPSAGQTVTGELDWPRRHTHMRTHTALHALSGVIFREHGAKVTGGNMECGGVARMDSSSMR